MLAVKVNDQAAAAPGRNHTDQHRIFSLTLSSAFLCLLCSKLLSVSLELQNLAQVLLLSQTWSPVWQELEQAGVQKY